MQQSTHLFQEYQKRDTVDQLILQFLAVQVDYCSQRQLLHCLSQIKLKSLPRIKLSAAKLSPRIRTMVTKDLVLKDKLGIRCPDQLRPYIVLDCLQKKRFLQLTKILQNILPTETNVYNSCTIYHNPREVLRELQISCYSGQGVKELYEKIRDAGEYFSFDEQGKDPFQQFLPGDIADDLIEFITVPTRVLILNNILSWAMEFLTPLNAVYYRQLIKQYHDHIIPDDFYPSSIKILLWRGDTRETENLINKQKWSIEEIKLGYAGWLAFIKGENKRAVEYFSQALLLHKKSLGKRKAYLIDYLGLFHILALIQSKKHEYLQQAYDLLLLMKRKKEPICKLLSPWQTVLEQQLDLPPADHTSMATVNSIMENEKPGEAFLMLLAMTWLKPQLIKEGYKTIEIIRDRSYNAGYLWISSIAAEILSFINVEPEKNSNHCLKIYKKTGLVALTTIVEPKPDWEMGLKTLIKLAESTTDSKTGPGRQRLIWLFAYNDEYNSILLEPRLQLLGKTNQWSKGRSVALKNLFNNAGTIEGLSGQDLRICSTLRQETERGGWGYSRRTVYRFDRDQVLQQLVDHPLLFDPKTMVRVELVRAEPEMRIQKTGAKIKIFFEPQPEDGRDITVIQETDIRYLIYHFNKKHHQMAQTLGSGFNIPKQGETLARRAADALSSLITVQSDIGGGTEAEKVKADASPHVQLLPIGKGLRLEILTRPFTSSGPYFQPGQGGKSVLAEIDGKKMLALRNLKAERKEAAKLVDTCPTISRFADGSNLWEFTEPSDCLEVLYELSMVDGVIVEWPKKKSYQFRSEVSFDKLSLQIKKETDWFKATGKLKIDDKLVLDLQQLLTKLQTSEDRFIRLDDGSFIALTKAFQKRLRDLSAYSTKSGKGVNFNPLASFALGDLLEQVGSCRGDKAWKNHLQKMASTMESELPTTLQAELRPYQEEGFRWLSRLAHLGLGGCLADDMGLGKTVQALAVLLNIAPKGPILVVAPLSVVANWQEEAHRFAPTLNVVLLNSGNRQEILDNLQPFDLLLCSYGLLPKEVEKLRQIRWQAVVLDEAQAIKNRHSKRSKAAMALKAQFRLITTGTPIENHLGELWTLFNFLTPGLLGGYKQFTDRYSNVANKEVEKSNQHRLRHLIRPFILRRLKSDVLSELPPRTEITIRVVMSKEEQALYEAQRRQALEILASESDEAKQFQVLAQIMRLRKLCCNPNLVLAENEKDSKNKAVASSKLEVFAETVSELIANKHKALVFSQFVTHLALIREYLDKQNISYQYLDGKTTPKQRQKRIADFQAGRGDLFLISLKAGGSGLNLTAADYVIHMDPWWNPAVEDQASDRAHRIGQNRPVTVYRLVMEGTIEEQIVELHNKKRDLADSLLEGSDLSGRMSSEELLQLLREQYN